MLRRTLLQYSTIPVLARFNLQKTAAATQNPAGIRVWLETSLQRVFPNTAASARNELRLISARNQRVSFQICVRNETTKRAKIECDVSGAPDLQVQVRRVGYVPLPHHTTDVPASDLDGLGCVPGLVPDPLFAEQKTSVGPWETQSFWITVTVPAEASPGSKPLTVRTVADSGPLESLTAHIDVRSFMVKPRRNFPVTHWWHADAIYEAYKIEPFGERWWQLVEMHMRNMASHGSNTMTVPLFHQRTEIVPKPCQLLGIQSTSPGRYEFDWTPVARFVELAKRNGIEYFEFPHLWLYWEIKYPIHVYQREGDHWNLLWPADAPATTGPFRVFLEQFLPGLHKFLTEQNLLEHSFFHVSDEPRGEAIENYRKAHALLTDLAPWTRGKVLDALSDIRYGKEGLVDIPVPLLPAAEKYREAKIPHWVYFCTGPRGKYLNRLFDTPLPKIRMAGFLFYRLGATGFLHWGYDYWFKMDTQQVPDLFHEGAGYAWPGIPYGDPFVVYPGPDGPLDSIRWEVFAEALQDYALLQSAGVDRDSALLSELKNYWDFPKTEEWIERTRARILDGAGRG
ncbi:MAG TPA: DUF4091 domain-containing protein [Bryobacteraceae bacterium]